jgi:hypothetical protein
MSAQLPAGNTRFSIGTDLTWTGTVLQVVENDSTNLTALANIKSGTGSYAIGTAYGGSGPWSATTIRNVDVQDNENGARLRITITYSDAPIGGEDGNPAATQPDDTPLYSLRESGLERAIEAHPNYLIQWDHFLLVREDNKALSTAVLEWEAAGPGDKPADQDLVRWVRKDQAWDHLDNGNFKWLIERTPSKPEVEAWTVPGPQVVETRWFSDYNDAVTYASSRRRGFRVAPDVTYGISDGDWLVMETTIDPDGVRWQTQTIYQWADVWDTDIYDGEET